MYKEGKRMISRNLACKINKLHGREVPSPIIRARGGRSTSTIAKYKIFNRYKTRERLFSPSFWYFPITHCCCGVAASDRKIISSLIELKINRFLFILFLKYIVRIIFIKYFFFLLTSKLNALRIFQINFFFDIIFHFSSAFYYYFTFLNVTWK